MSKLRIQYISPEKVKDQKILEAISKSVIKGTPRAESQAIRARVPNVFWSFQNTWNDVFIEGKVDHNLKELCRVYVSKSVQCKYCGNQRSSKSADDGLVEMITGICWILKNLKIMMNSPRQRFHFHRLLPGILKQMMISGIVCISILVKSK
ncbi:MAG: hypothetical protein CM1200mP30_00990 [Pseudomonadota bacterium]|nr:MAG: hypothetical protein CM1200mP30_00990 [Pseudomonadota bacterium]